MLKLFSSSDDLWARGVLCLLLWISSLSLFMDGIHPGFKALSIVAMVCLIPQIFFLYVMEWIRHEFPHEIVPRSEGAKE